MKYEKDIVGRVDAVLVGAGRESVEQEKINVGVGLGVQGDKHAGQRWADVRETAMMAFGLPKGTPISNHREVSVISIEELSAIYRNLGILQTPLGCLGENLVLRGVPRLTQLPIGTMLFFRGKEKRTAVLMCTGENTPCLLPGENLARRYGMFANDPDIAKKFVKEAIGLRGIVSQVYSSGRICKDDEVVVKVPARSEWYAE